LEVKLTTRLACLLQAANPAEDLGSVTGQALELVRVLFILAAVRVTGVCRSETLAASTDRDEESPRRPHQDPGKDILGA